MRLGYLNKQVLLCMLSVMPVASTTVLAQSMQTYVIDSFGGESLVSVIQPVLVDGGSVSSYQGRLVVRTTPANYADIQRLLKQVDTAPKQLKLSLRVKETGHYSNRGVNVGDVVISRNHAGKWGMGADIGVDYRHGSRQGSSLYTVNTLSGYRANIDSGTLMSLSRAYVTRYGISSEQSLVPITRGMSVLPRQLPDGRVQLDVSQQYDTMKASTSSLHNPQIQTQNSQTQVVVSPNQWVSLGNIVQKQSHSRTLGKSSSYINIPIEVKVEPIK